ncbi:glycosyltransferase [Sulfolobus tengchongensis]|uniref:Glycosyltransferase n=1 Tax=Sulfolobus tengchongensis TaxID=207809 RepID=A0AAX4KXJ9_9CREN
MNKDELYKNVSKAKLLIYPSLADGFSLVILESLAVGTPVISYNFFPIYSAYKNVPAVRFSSFNNSKFAKIVYSSLNDEFQNSVNDERTLNFIKKNIIGRK